MTVKHTIRYLGFHIGSRISSDIRFFRITNQLIFGTRFGFVVHDIDRTVYLMRKALLFLYNLNLSKVENLFMGSPLNNTPINNHILKVFLDKKSYIIHGVSFTYLD